MIWDCMRIRRKLNSDHDRIYSDIDQMKSKMRREPDRYEYGRFTSEETGKLYACILLKDSATLETQSDFLNEVCLLMNYTDEKVIGLASNEDVEHDFFMQGWRAKLSDLSRGYN